MIRRLNGIRYYYFEILLHLSSLDSKPCTGYLRTLFWAHLWFWVGTMPDLPSSLPCYVCIPQNSGRHCTEFSRYFILNCLTYFKFNWTKPNSPCALLVCAIIVLIWIPLRYNSGLKKLTKVVGSAKSVRNPESRGKMQKRIPFSTVVLWLWQMATRELLFLCVMTRIILVLVMWTIRMQLNHYRYAMQTPIRMKKHQERIPSLRRRGERMMRSILVAVRLPAVLLQVVRKHHRLVHWNETIQRWRSCCSRNYRKVAFRMPHQGMV